MPSPVALACAKVMMSMLPVSRPCCVSISLHARARDDLTFHPHVMWHGVPRGIRIGSTCGMNGPI